jgi:hypothetical protein
MLLALAYPWSIQKGGVIFNLVIAVPGTAYVRIVPIVNYLINSKNGGQRRNSVQLVGKSGVDCFGTAQKCLFCSGTDGQRRRTAQAIGELRKSTAAHFLTQALKTLGISVPSCLFCADLRPICANLKPFAPTSASFAPTSARWTPSCIAGA